MKELYNAPKFEIFWLMPKDILTLSKDDVSPFPDDWNDDDW